MIAVITGDIVNSRLYTSEKWIATLQQTLSAFGESPKNWEVYRGDSFQLSVTPQEALRAAFIIKAAMKTYKDLDVRMAIGVGDVDYDAPSVTASNGSAFVNSGEGFDKLKKEMLYLTTSWADFDRQLQIMLDLCIFIANNWKPKTALIIQAALANNELNQQQLAQQLKKSQGNISEGMKRGGYNEIKAVIDFYQSELLKLCSI